MLDKYNYLHGNREVGQMIKSRDLPGKSVTIAAKALLVCAAYLLSQPVDLHARTTDFPRFVQDMITEVFRNDDPAFRLSKAGKGGVVVHGRERHQFYMELACERDVSIDIGSYTRVNNQLRGESRLGAISVSLCDSKVINESQAKNFQRYAGRIFKLLAGESAEKQQELSELLEKINRDDLHGNGEIFRFPVLVMGQGAMLFHTSVAIPGDKDYAFVIQYGLNERFCRQAPKTLICRDPEGSIKQVAELLIDKWQDR
jgi:hypothetical protein